MYIYVYIYMYMYMGPESQETVVWYMQYPPPLPLIPVAMLFMLQIPWIPNYDQIIFYYYYYCCAAHVHERDRVQETLPPDFLRRNPHFPDLWQLRQLLKRPQVRRMCFVF
jgi:hypothetical protein